MIRVSILSIGIACFHSVAMAEDLRLRIDTVGIKELDSNEKEPKETILRSIETQIVPGAKFASRATYQDMLMALTGSAIRNADSSFTIRVRYKHRHITQELIAASVKYGADLEQVAPGTSAESTLTLKPGDTQTLGSMYREMRDPSGSQRFSNTKLVITLIDLDTESETNDAKKNTP